MFGAGIEIEQKEITNGEIFVGFAFDNTYGPMWYVVAGTDEKELKQEMGDDGADLEHSFVIKVQVPKGPDSRKEVNIKTIDLTAKQGEQPTKQ